MIYKKIEKKSIRYIYIRILYVHTLKIQKMYNKRKIQSSFKNTETGITFIMEIDSELPITKLVKKIHSKVINELGINTKYQIIKSGILCENSEPLNLNMNCKFKDLKCTGFYIKPIRNDN